MTKKTNFGVITKKGRFVSSDLLGQYATKSGEESRQLPADSFISMYGELDLVLPPYVPEALANILEINTYHSRCCRTKARDTAGLGYSIKPINDNGKAEGQIYKKIDDFFSNQEESISAILDKMMLDYETIGYGALELVRDGYQSDGEPVLLAHIPAQTLRLHKEGQKACQIRGGKRRWFKTAGVREDINAFTGTLEPEGTLDPSLCGSEIIWFHNYTPRSDYYGLPDVIPALGAIYGDISRRNYNMAFFDNFGVPAYAVFVSGNFDPGEVDESGRSELAKSIEDHFADLADNPHSVLIMTIPTQGRDEEVKVEFKQLSVETKEASFRLFRVDNRDEIITAHGVPPYRIGVNETGSLGGSTAVESTKIYKNSVLRPRQERIESTINRIIVWGGFEANDYAFNLAEIDIDDEIADVDMCGKLFSLGAMTPNQLIRRYAEKYGLEEVDHPAMNAHYVNGQPIDYEPPSSMVESELTETNGVEMAMYSLQNRLVDIAEKAASNNVHST